MTSSRTWGEFFDPYCGGGARWRPFRFRSPSWMTSFAGTGNEVIQDGDRKRKGRHLAPPPQWGSKNSPYTTNVMYHCIEFCHDLSLGLGVWNTIHLGSWNVTWYGFMECDMVWYIHVKWLTLWSWWWIIGIWCAVLVFVVTLSGPDNHRVHCSDWLGRVTLVLVHDVFASMT